MNKINPIQIFQFLMFGMIAVAMFKVMQYFGVFGDKYDKTKSDGAQDEVELEQSNGLTQSYSDNKYNELADTLYYADGYFDDDESAINGVAQDMKNDLDLAKLNSALIAGQYGYGLSVYLDDVFNASEQTAWNKITADNGCTKKY